MATSPELNRVYEDEQLAEDYFKYRPIYPDYFVDSILKYMGHSKDETTKKPILSMLDVGCGSGQATHMFSDHCESILGIDISANQIEVAKKYNKNKNVTFQLVHDNFFPCQNESIDLVNCATAVHWLDMKTFESECNRVLKPNGCVAVYAYLMNGMKSCKEPDLNLQTQFNDLIMKYITECNGHKESKLPGYQQIFDQIENPTKEWVNCPNHDNKYTLLQFKNYMSTLGEYHTYMAGNPEIDSLDRMGDTIKKALKEEDSNDNDVIFNVPFGYHFFLFRKQC